MEFLSISSSSPWRPLSGALEAREMLECVSLPQYQPGDELTEEASPLFQFALHKCITYVNKSRENSQ